jgi:hypothetical protein
MSMRRVLAPLFLAALLAVFALVAGTATGAAATAPQVDIVAFAGHAKGLQPPSDAVQPGDTYTPCRVDYLKRLYAFVRFSGLRNGAPTSVAWFVNGSPAYVDRFAWSYGTSGSAWFYLFRQKGLLKDGAYRVEIRVDSKLIARASVGLAAAYC